jgi:methionine sulfoxide reductase heme-binding subunit
VPATRFLLIGRYLLLCMPALPALAYWTWALQDALGANPVEALLRGLGEWSLVGLCLTLTVSPLSKWLRQPQWVVWRRRLGLWTFAYVLQHAAVYVVFDMPGLALVVQDIVERPFITVGFASALILMALAATSFTKARLVLGPKRWKRLHQMVYASAALSMLHFYWMRAGKNDFADVWLYGLWLLVVLALRVYQPKFPNALRPPN